MTDESQRQDKPSDRGSECSATLAPFEPLALLLLVSSQRRWFPPTNVLTGSPSYSGTSLLVSLWCLVLLHSANEIKVNDVTLVA